MKKVMLVAGARPNFMKIAPILRAIDGTEGLEGILVHTGQHYDRNMSGSFFQELGIKEPDYHLNVGPGTHAEQTAKIMVAFERACAEQNPDVVMVVGDVNSTVAAGLVAKKMGTVLAHVEAGLRSGDRRMPEEINRIATDAITDVFFTTEETGTANLVREGHSMSDVHFVGHVMIDNLLYQKERLREESLPEELRMLRRRLPERYVCMTMHRPSNVDDKEKLTELLKAAKTIAEEAPVIFPCHPRTRKQIAAFGLESMLGHGRLSGTGRIGSGILMTEPLSYNAFLYFWSSAALVLTDSGGLQEETTALGIPCVTMRDSTERPVTVEIGSNVIVGADGAKAVEHGLAALSGNWKKSRVPRLWDGRASERIVDILAGRTQSVP